nr:MAG TPA: hypothetical protein [Caudoviricetes sp.]
MSLPTTQIKNISPVDTRAYELAAQVAADRPSIFGNLAKLVNQGEQAFASERANNVRDLIRHGVLGGLTPEEALGQVRNDSRFSNNDFENAKVDDLMKDLNDEWRAKNADARSAEELAMRQAQARRDQIVFDQGQADRADQRAVDAALGYAATQMALYGGEGGVNKNAIYQDVIDKYGTTPQRKALLLQKLGIEANAWNHDTYADEQIDLSTYRLQGTDKFTPEALTAAADAASGGQRLLQGYGLQLTTDPQGNLKVTSSGSIDDFVSKYTDKDSWLGTSPRDARDSLMNAAHRIQKETGLSSEIAGYLAVNLARADGPFYNRYSNLAWSPRVENFIKNEGKDLYKNIELIRRTAPNVELLKNSNLVNLKAAYDNTMGLVAKARQAGQTAFADILERQAVDTYKKAKYQIRQSLDITAPLAKKYYKFQESQINNDLRFHPTQEQQEKNLQDLRNIRKHFQGGD